MSDPVEVAARAAADQLAAVYGPALPTEVEAALQARGYTPPDRYVDPVAIGALIVSITTLAWTVYTDLRNRTPAPSSEVVSRTVRVRLGDTGDLDTASRDRIIEVVVGETIRIK